MKKRTPSYNLKFIQYSFPDTESLIMSSIARRRLGNLGISLDELVQIIQILTEEHFVQTICLSSDFQLWRDIYSIPWGNTNLFLNFEMTDADELMITLDTPERRML